MEMFVNQQTKKLTPKFNYSSYILSNCSLLHGFTALLCKKPLLSLRHVDASSENIAMNIERLSKVCKPS